MLDENGNLIEDTETVVTEETAEAEADKVRSEAKEKSEKTDKKTSDEAAKLLKEVMALKAKLKEKDSALNVINEKYKDIDLDAARDALKQAEEAETKELERKGEYERLLAKQKEKAEALIEAERSQRTEAEKRISDLQRSIDELSLGNAFASSKFIQDKMALTPNKTRALYAAHFEVEDGKLVAYDKPRGATDRTPLINTAGESLTFEDAIAEIVNGDPDKDYLLKADVKQGAGSKQTTVKTDVDNNKRLDSVSKIAQGLTNPKNFGPDNLR
jgi:hypothetical protein